MQSDDQGGQKKTDWSQVTGALAKSPDASRTLPVQQADAENNSADLPAPSRIEVPEMTAPAGILTQFKENRIKRKSALAALQTHYDKQLDVLTHTLSRVGQVEKARADVIAEEYLKELDAKHLEVLVELGMRNKQTRERALLELTDQTVKTIQDVMAKDWPEELISETINQLFSLRKRVIAELLKELGSDYASDV